MNEISNETKLQAVLEIYSKDREEEKVQWNRLHNLFTTFMLLFLGATNAFIQLTNPTFTTWLVFALSIVVASALYWYLHAGMQLRLYDAAKIKEGREILIKLLLNGTSVYDYQNNLINPSCSIDEFETRIKSPDYPFIALHDIVKLKLTYQENTKKYIVVFSGAVVSALTFVYWFFQ